VYGLPTSWLFQTFDDARKSRADSQLRVQATASSCQALHPLQGLRPPFQAPSELVLWLLHTGARYELAVA
ncbi:MAG: hypothetical protein ACJ797_25045, partial [Ktedonobacteraceae bacterium]